MGRGLGVGFNLGVGVGRGVIVAVGVAVAVAVAVGVAVAVAVAVAVGVGVAVGVDVAVGVAVGVGLGLVHDPLMATLSTRQPACETELSEHILQRTFTCWPTPAAGKFTVVVSNPPEPPLEMPLQVA